MGRIPAAIRNIVWNTYIGIEKGTNPCYLRCGETISHANFECGHIISAKENGPDTISNLRPICSACNKSMGATCMIDFILKYEIHTINKDPIKKETEKNEKSQKPLDYFSEQYRKDPTNIIKKYFTNEVKESIDEFLKNNNNDLDKTINYIWANFVKQKEYKAIRLKIYEDFDEYQISGQKSDLNDDHHCKAILKDGRPCKNIKKQGDYCGVHGKGKAENP